MDRPSPISRAAAWLVTGPIGHFAGGVYDWAVFFRRLGREHIRRRRASRP